jgi:hypothetical protein
MLDGCPLDQERECTMDSGPSPLYLETRFQNLYIAWSVWLLAMGTALIA